ncbi:hypothetical protein BpHYR1_014446 [Brachionus plicatilis]|uniref:Uncharacterized protein n=1 Tax=Brachionus plicatilis TaxID=10195 RepID=A0A3M7RK72_BRAPC|nr:hypothetical protein BpHYR1_014446 [Brachionus plicatilis]
MIFLLRLDIMNKIRCENDDVVPSDFHNIKQKLVLQFDQTDKSVYNYNCTSPFSDSIQIPDLDSKQKTSEERSKFLKGHKCSIEFMG